VTRSLRRILLAGVLLALAQPSAGFGNGLDIFQTSGKPGEEVVVEGHFWVTCCPTVPEEHVRLYLVTPERRIELFDERADRQGTVFASFSVPDVPPGRYRLESCGSPTPATGGRPACRPGVPFRVLAGAAGGGLGGLALALAIALPLLLLLGAAGFLRRLRRRAT